MKSFLSIFLATLTAIFNFFTTEGSIRQLIDKGLISAVSANTFGSYQKNMLCLLIHNKIPENRKLWKRVYIEPFLPSTTSTVFSRMRRSMPIFHSWIYFLSSFTTSSKSVILLLPLTCQRPVMPGFTASLALW